MDHIQAHGWLMILDRDDIIRHASANLALLAHQPLEMILGRPVRQVIGRVAAQALSRARRHDGDGGVGPLTVTVVTGKGRVRAVMQGHLETYGLVLELEPVFQGDSSLVAASFGAAIRRYRHLQDIEALARAVTRDARLLTGFDHAMMLRIGDKGQPVMIASDAATEVPPLPAPAFEPLSPALQYLLELNRVRLLADIPVPPVPVLPGHDPASGAPIALPRAVLRPATHGFAEFASARGVRSVLIVSLLCAGRLWGYIWCENRRPRHVNVPVRSVFEGLGEIAAAQIAAMEERDAGHARTRATRALTRLGRLMQGEMDIVQALARLHPVLEEILPHDALAITIEGKSWQSPDTLPASHWLEQLDRQDSPRHEGLRWGSRDLNGLSREESGLTDILDIDLQGGHILILRRGQQPWSTAELEAAHELHHLLAERRAELYRRNAERQLHRLTNFDRATGLPNRAHLLRALEQALEVEADVAVTVLGLDRFRVLKAAFGEEAADRLLAAVGQRLREHLDGGDLVARIDTGELAVLLLEEGPQRIDRLTARVRDALRAPISLDGRDIFVSASVGVVVTGSDAAGMLRDAEIASAEAEAAGGGRRVFDDAMRTRLTERHEIYDRLRQAIYMDEGVYAAYQPIIRLSDGHLAGFEALARWTDGERGNVPPSIFVPVAEETGLIMALGNHILVQACRQVVRWNQGRVGKPLYISVNLSPYQFDPSRLDLVRWVSGVLDMTGCRPEWLQLEITESGLIGQGGVAPELLRGLRQLGVGLAIDDFGTGYSSLAYLQELPVDTIKIDRSFVERMMESEKGKALITAILHIAGIMEYGVVAEGVETVSQADLLRQMGCERAQGYHYARPLTPDAATAMVREMAGLVAIQGGEAAAPPPMLDLRTA
ncbi:EAL domain-containing protein [Niveispirillum irakense]|uniref:EAL domain-containing protein n=1 Tax=Niveispirillum irakense TaxID=34011 RepID=UPI0003FC4A67|nr:EAL domain-containing protein [Niveispirillum irakense]